MVTPKKIYSSMRVRTQKWLPGSSLIFPTLNATENIINGVRFIADYSVYKGEEINIL